MNKLIDVMSAKGRTIEILTHYIQEYIDDQWEQVWNLNLEKLENVYVKNGDVAYGIYISKLFHPVMREIYEAGLKPKPLLPGDFRQSKESWGPWEERERRFWSVIYQENDQALGTLFTSIFHDHTCLRIPKPPKLYFMKETDSEYISRSMLIDNPEAQNLIPEEE
ncbi:DUF6022 family protein [Oceanobacillus jeddahense]|uniref:DUF6022 family protein n=1 Tax=Oceanobacillus jeddahense TaxID=1462527 RepID=UPI00363C52FF